jgi:hypothetical protein
MLVTVRHIQSTREMNSTFDDNKRLEIAKDALRHNQYIRVAEFEADENEKPLSLAYELTNSIDFPWYERTNINVSLHAREGCRSTSVGDIIQVQGRSYMVAGIGFIEITKG